MDVHIPLVLHLLYPVPSVVLRQGTNHIVIVTFSEAVRGFTEADVTTDGEVTRFTGNGIEFCVEFSNATYAEVAAGVCESFNGIENSASNRLVLDA